MNVLESLSDPKVLNDILLRLPNRQPGLLIDKITYIEPNKFLAAIKNVTRNEQAFDGATGNTYYPSTLILESLIQAATILASHEHSLAKNYSSYQNLLSGLTDVEFKIPVAAGDQLLLSIESKIKKPYVWEFEASASTEENVVATATIYLKRMDDLAFSQLR